MGCSVKLSHGVGAGWPDTAVGFGGLTLLVEIKSGKGKLNDRQLEWLEDWTGGHYVVRNLDDVERLVSMVRGWHRILWANAGVQMS
jgi:thiosulfate reductase cytochrome b subunit